MALPNTILEQKAFSTRSKIEKHLSLILEHMSPKIVKHNREGLFTSIMKAHVERRSSEDKVNLFNMLEKPNYPQYP